MDSWSVSVVVPCHNAQAYLAQTLGSILDQTRTAEEIIVVDDGSTDGSVALARLFEEGTGGRVRVFAERAGSAAVTRNLGALAATGTALMFLDADDVLRPDALAGLIAALSEQPDGVAVCPWFRLQLDGGRWVERPPSCTPRTSGEDPLSAWLRGWYHPPCSVLWSRTAFARAGRWDELAPVNQDGDLMMRALACGVPFLETTAGAAYYRRLPGGQPSLSGGRLSRAGLAARIRIIRKVAASLEEHGGLRDYTRALARGCRLIAADAQAREPDLAADALALAAQYDPQVRFAARTALRRVHRSVRSLTSSVRRRNGGTAKPAPPQAPAGQQEIRWGLESAARVLSVPPARTQAGRRIEQPAVSILVPTYNRAHLLPRALESALAQTFADFELLVIDDGSTDGTADLVRACRDARVRYLRQPSNRGVSAARNRGLREARGRFIALLDSDDEWLPEKLERQMARFDELPPHVGLLYCGVENVDGLGQRSIREPAHRGNVYRHLLLGNVIHGTSGVVMRRSVVAAAGFFDEQIPAIEDYDYWLRVARFFEFDYLPEPLTRYHQPVTERRKSLDLQDNLDARWWFFRKHRREMRRAGVAHLFLLTSVRRAMKAPDPQVGTARRLAARAVFEAPLSRMALRALAKTWLPAPAPLAASGRRSGA